MEYTGRPNPARTVSYKAFYVSDFSVTVCPTGLYINLVKAGFLTKAPAGSNQLSI